MCLAIPGRVLEFRDEGGLRMSKVDFGGVTREACLEYLPEAQVGDYVLVHAGFAITKVDPDEAALTIATIKEMGRADETP